MVAGGRRSTDAQRILTGLVVGRILRLRSASRARRGRAASDPCRLYGAGPTMRSPGADVQHCCAPTAVRPSQAPCRSAPSLAEDLSSPSTSGRGYSRGPGKHGGNLMSNGFRRIPWVRSTMCSITSLTRRGQRNGRGEILNRSWRLKSGTADGNFSYRALRRGLRAISTATLTSP